MTDLTPGSRWLLPVTFSSFNAHPEHPPGTRANVAINGVRWVSIPPSELDTLIPADRITELEAEVARLKAHVDKFQGLYDAARGDVVEGELKVERLKYALYMTIDPFAAGTEQAMELLDGYQPNEEQ